MDPVAQLILEQKWSDHVVRRRLDVWKRRARGERPDAIAPLWGVSLRMIFYDLAELRELMVQAAAPEIEEIRYQVDAQLQEVFREAMAAHAEGLEKGMPRSGFLAAARGAAHDRAKLHGAIDDRSRLEVHLPGNAPAQQLATKTGDELKEIAADQLEAIAELTGPINGSGNDIGNDRE